MTFGSSGFKTVFYPKKDKKLPNFYPLICPQLKISAKPVDIVIVNVYMPTTDHDGDERENCATRSVTYCIKKEEII
jgi:hypothetical protein